jgi:hypothetical protein
VDTIEDGVPFNFTQYDPDDSEWLALRDRFLRICRDRKEPLRGFYSGMGRNGWTVNPVGNTRRHRHRPCSEPLWPNIKLSDETQLFCPASRPHARRHRRMQPGDVPSTVPSEGVGPPPYSGQKSKVVPRTAGIRKQHISVTPPKVAIAP